MFDLTSLLISTAYAQAADAPAAAGGISSLMNFLPLLLIFAVFYFLIIRPQQKRMDEQNKMIKALNRGDQVVTSGGIFGKIVKFEGDDVVGLEVADGLTIRILRSQIGALADKAIVKPANGAVSTDGNAKAS